MRLHAHRALRLFVTAGAWAAGFCLIVALVALVADAAGPTGAAPVQTTARRVSLHPTAGPTRRPPAAPVLRTFSGIGDQTTPQFTVAAHSWWKVQWLYQCTPGVPGEGLIVREGDTAGNGISVSASGVSGRGEASAYAAGRAHYLVVITNCAWTARVLGRD
jgi:hypothetical protein